MHELGIVQEVVAIAAESAEGRRVRRVVLEIGALTAVVPDALLFAFELVAEGTVVQGAALEIRDVPARGRCRRCATDVELGKVWGACTCGSMDLEIISGNELRVKELEVE
jgi:hydrogenase nickel incorporation protein HypA/HybF